MNQLKIPFETILSLTISIFLSLGCQTDKSPDPLKSSSAKTDSWKLVFEDEFDSLSSWNIWYGGAYNNEIQLYREEQLSLDEGILKINVKRKMISGPTRPNDHTPKNFEYVSGRIESRQTYGPSDQEGERTYRFMARIKLPYGHGMWPAFWSYGDPWPTQGEIDILEARGNETELFSSNIYYGISDGINLNTNTEAKHEIGQDLTEDFHVYEMIWGEDSIQILFDNQLIHTYKADSNNNINRLLGKKQKIVFNTAVGGWFFKDQNSNNYADNATMEIDWVRVYKK